MSGVDDHAGRTQQPEDPRMPDPTIQDPQTTNGHTEDGDVRTYGREAIPEIAELIKDIDICMFATRSADGELHARPMSNNGRVEWDGDSWFFAPADGRLVGEIRRNPEAVTTYRADDRFAWVALSGRAEIVEDAERKRQLWLDELERWFRNGPDDPNVALVRVASTAAQWWTEKGDGNADLA
jgi:general stress protein 26